ncbi:MAG: DUF1906 domain-containing protein, partial [Oscillospiraceae bacterium]|nr:DUF1906 domain-containing protein [Oscillospiraceae bacterium]
MRNLKKILSCTLALSMLTTIIPADMAKLAGIESQEIFCELAEDNDYKNFKNYIDFVTEFCGSPPVGNGDPYVWSAQQWFNYKYCKTDNDNGIFNPDTELSKTKFYGVYTDNGNDFKSYTNLEIDPSNRYDTMYSLKCALQVELLYYGIDKNTEDGDFLTIDKMYGWYGDGEVLNFFGSFGETTRAAFDQMMKDYGGLSNLPSDILRIINYGLVVKGYGSLCSDGNLPYSSGTFDDNIKKGISKLVEEAGIKDKYSDIENDFDSILLKAILNTDSYSIYDDGDDKIRELQILLNSKIYDDYIYDGDSKSIIGIGPCDGIYGRDTCKRLIYYYQKLIFEGFDIKPNGYFGEGTLMHSPDISADSEVNQDIIKLVKYAYYVNGYNPGIINDNVGYDIRTENAAKSFKSFMHLPNSDDGVTYKDTIKSLMSSSGDTNRTARACDTNAQLTEEDIKALKENGYEYVGRYVVDERFEKKRLSKEEAYNIISAGLKIIPIYQGFNCGDPDDFTVIKAQKDIVDSLNSAVKIGIPRGSTLYYAVDCDPYDEEIEDYVLKYFDELKRLMLSYGNFYEIGVYGTRNVCKKVYDAGFAKSAYIADASTGFSGNMGYQMPRCWAFDQFSVSVEDAEIYVGKIQIDKVAVSGLDNAVSRLDETVQSEYESAKKSAPVMENLIIGNTYGDPVNLAFGSHEIEYTAVSVSGAQNIDFSLSYSSAESAEGEMGSGSYHNYEKHIEPYTETYKGIPSFGLDEEGNPL